LKEILVDANVLVSFFTDRNPDQQKKAEALFEAAADREHVLAFHTITIAEMVFVLRNVYKSEPREIAQALRELWDLPGVIPVEEVAWERVLELWPQEIPGFADAVLASVALQGRYDAVATFDDKLRKKLKKQSTASYWSD
jgi:predicted nucleic acid-binding protein